MRMQMSFMKVNTEVKMNSTECFFFQPTDYTSSATVCKWCGKEKYQHKSEQKQLIIDIMNEDAKDGLYKQQTAVDWLTEKVKSKEWQDMFIWHKEEVFKQAKEIEKQQIINAHLTGLIRPLEIEATKQAEQYYNEEYGKNINDNTNL